MTRAKLPTTEYRVRKRLLGTVNDISQEIQRLQEIKKSYIFILKDAPLKANGRPRTGVQRICVTCRVKFVAPPSLIKNRPTLYCSHKCMGEARKKGMDETVPIQRSERWFKLKRGRIHWLTRENSEIVGSACGWFYPKQDVEIMSWQQCDDDGWDNVCSNCADRLLETDTPEHLKTAPSTT